MNSITLQMMSFRITNDQEWAVFLENFSGGTRVFDNEIRVHMLSRRLKHGGGNFSRRKRFAVIFFLFFFLPSSLSLSLFLSDFFFSNKRPTRGAL